MVWGRVVIREIWGERGERGERNWLRGVIKYWLGGGVMKEGWGWG